MDLYGPDFFGDSIFSEFTDPIIFFSDSKDLI